MTAINWFRLYTEARNDAKLRSLSDPQHRTWFNLLCFAAAQPERGIIQGYDDQLLAIEVANGDVDILQSTLEILIRLRIITMHDDNVVFINFSKRQYDKPSDHPDRVKERVKKHRANKSNATVTPSNTLYTETDTETDTENKTPLPPMGELPFGIPVEISPGSPEGEGAQPTKAGKGATEYTTEFDMFWEAYPRRKEKQAAFRCWKARLREGTQPRLMIEAARLYADECRRKGTQEEFIKQAKTFLGSSKPFLEYFESNRKVVSISAGASSGGFKPYTG